jgi:hypothetical protein
MNKEAKITNLPELVDKLPKKQRELFNRFYSVAVSESRLKVPYQMKKFVKTKVGSLKRVENQKIISINNNFTGEGSLFNELRSLRPKPKTKVDLKDLKNNENCHFCDPEAFTPLDFFGRIKGKYCITASNIAKYDYFHSMIIFKEHNPLKIKAVWLKDYFETAEKWFNEVLKMDNEAKNTFLIWNNLWRAGASIIHGHMQLTASRMKYGKIKKLEETYEGYRKKFKSNYFSDLSEVHKSLGLLKKVNKTNVLFYLTPIKEKEILIFSKEKRFPNLSDLIYKIIQNYFRLGVQSFNLSLYKIKDYWVVHIVDRGSLENRNSDIGTMELYGNSVIAFDPFKLRKFNKLIY